MTNNTVSHSFTASNKITKGLVYSTIDVLGIDDFKRRLEEEKSISIMLTDDQFYISGLSTFLELVLKKYGENAVHGLSQRIGMVFFHYLRRNFSNVISTNNPEARLWPFHERVEADFSMLFQWLQNELKFHSGISKQQKEWIIELKFPPDVCEDSLVSFFFKGILQEFYEWLDCHYRYRIDLVNSIKDHFHLIRYMISYSPLE